MISVSVQHEDFSHAEEYQKLSNEDTSQGAIVTFTGCVRAVDEKCKGADEVLALELECYPGMTEKVLHNIAKDAKQRWSIGSISIIHRIGKLPSSSQIVFVGVTSSHRQSAFEACEFIIDTLKTAAPFWKKEYTKQGEHWVEAKQSDTEKVSKWLID